MKGSTSMELPTAVPMGTPAMGVPVNAAPAPLTMAQVVGQAGAVRQFTRKLKMGNEVFSVEIGGSEGGMGSLPLPMSLKEKVF